MTSHGSKIKCFPKTLMLDQIRRIIHDFDLLVFVDCSLTMLNVSLLTDFVERWHKETSSFHLPFGEMTITLDDVSSLFHFAITDRFFTNTIISSLHACMMAVRDLGVFEEVVLEEFEFTRGVHLRLSWLRDRYDELVKAQMFEAPARVYMLHLVTCTLFVTSQVFILTLDTCGCSVALTMSVGLKDALRWPSYIHHLEL